MEETKDDPWDAWIDEYGWRLLAHARQLLTEASEAEDVVQTAVVELWRRDAFPPDLALALTKVRQRAVDLARSRKSRRQREERWQSDGPKVQVVDFTQGGSLVQQAVEQAMVKLDVIFREVVSLKLWSELTFDEIGELLGISRNTAASRYRLALQKLEPLLRSIENLS